MAKKEFKSLHDKITEGVISGISKAVEQHRLEGRPIVVSKNGKIVWIPASKIPAAK